jgi:hypothetical protein
MQIQRLKAPGATVWCRVFARIHRNSVPGDAIFLTFRLKSLLPLLLPALAHWRRVSDPHCATLRVSVEHSGTTCFYMSDSVKRLLWTSTVVWISCDGSPPSSSLSSSVKQVRYAVEIVCSFLSELVSFWLSSLVLISGVPFSSFLFFCCSFAVRCFLSVAVFVYVSGSSKLNQVW